jgi:hypothetical protein
MFDGLAVHTNQRTATEGGLAADYLQGGLVLAIRWQIFSQFLADLAEHSS